MPGARAIKIGVITNPNSKKNRSRRDRAAELQHIVGDLGVVKETRTVDEIRPAVEEFLDRDVRYWVSDGGDGALHWLINEARREFGARGLALPLTVPTNGGTIDFVAKKVGIRGQADEILQRIVAAEHAGRDIPIEEVPSFLMSGTRLDADGAERAFEKIGFTAAIAGIGQKFFDLYYEEPLPGPDTLVKIIAKGAGSIVLNAIPFASRLPLLPRTWLDYAGKLVDPARASLTIDGVPERNQDWRGIHVGSLFVNIGGVVRLFPLAGNGKLHAMYGNPTTLGVLRNLPNLLGGRPMGHGLVDRACTEVAVEAPPGETLRPCIDGEMFGGIRKLRMAPGPLIRIPKIDCRA